MNGKEMEKKLIEHCAPTLAGLKCASLFNYFHEGESIVQEELEVVFLLSEMAEKVTVCPDLPQTHPEARAWSRNSPVQYKLRSDA